MIRLLVKTNLKRAVHDGCSIEKSKIRFYKAFSKFKTRNISLSGLTAKTTSSDLEKYWKKNHNIRWSSSGSSIVSRWAYPRVQTKMGRFRKRTGKRFGQDVKRWRKALRNSLKIINANKLKFISNDLELSIAFSLICSKSFCKIETWFVWKFLWLFFVQLLICYETCNKKLNFRLGSRLVNGSLECQIVGQWYSEQTRVLD